MDPTVAVVILSNAVSELHYPGYPADHQVMIAAGFTHDTACTHWCGCDRPEGGLRHCPACRYTPTVDAHCVCGADTWVGPQLTTFAAGWTWYAAHLREHGQETGAVRAEAEAVLAALTNRHSAI